MATTNRAERRREQFGKHRAAKESGWPTSAPNPVFRAHPAPEPTKTSGSDQDQTDRERPKAEGSGPKPSSPQDAATVDQ